jgi:PAS domain S-box-containing protein
VTVHHPIRLSRRRSRAGAIEMKWIRYLKQYGLPAHLVRWEDQTYPARTVLLIALGGMSIALTLLISGLVRGWSAQSLPSVILGAAICAGSGLLAARGREQMAAGLLVVLPPVLVALAVVDSGQLGSAPFFCSLSLVIAGVTMRPREVVLALIGVMLTLVSMTILSACAIDPPGSAGKLLIDALVLAGATALIAGIGTSSVAHATQQIQVREQATLQAEQALHASEARNRLIAEHARDLIALLDAEGRFRYASPSYARELGHVPSTLIGASRANLIHPEDLPLAIAHWHQARRQGSTQAVYRIVHADGSWRWIETRLSAVTHEGAPHVVLVGRDITARRTLEAQLQQAQKLEALGRLAGGVAHDFNNLLTVITGSTELASAALPANHPAQHDLALARAAGDRAAALVQQVLVFARRQVARPRPLHLGAVIHDFRPLLERLIGPPITLVTDIAPNLWPIQADPAQITQLLMNLAINARDAMPAGGTLTIAAANVLYRPSAQTQSALPLDPTICLTVADTGVGMSEEVQRHLFEPFYTTKALDQGTGLGLATVYGIVRQSGGAITVASAIGAGTTFTIFLPRIVEEPDP